MTTQMIHASCVEIMGRGVLLLGPSGSGKSDLALRLIDRGATLVSDDQVILTASESALIAGPPPKIAGKIEVRGLGIISLPFARDVRLSLAVDLAGAVERFPLEPQWADYLDHRLALVALSAHEASATIKVERALELAARGV
jgi:serine kinase of HPr protein (carbohydrate metabolism regulator)